MAQIKKGVGDFHNDTYPIGEGSIHFSYRYRNEPVLVFLYGGLGDIDRTTWESIIERLPDSCGILTYDRPGIGLSKPLPPPRTALEMSSELKSLLDHLSIKKVILIGHSMGGLYARFFASRFPDYVQGLLLLDATHENQLRMTSHLMNQSDLEASIAASQNNRERIKVPQDPEMSFAMMRQYPDLPDSFDSIIVAAKNSLPSGYPNSEEINRINIELQKNLASTSSKAEFIIAEESSHFIYLNQPDLVVDLIKKLGCKFTL